MNTSSEEQVRHYLAHWFQLGKKVLSLQGYSPLYPQPVFEGDRYSREFERCWQEIVTSDRDGYYLEGTDQSIQELLSPVWDVTPCARCNMPIPMRNSGVVTPCCPCADLPDWPNFDLPQPRSQVDTTSRLQQIRDRLHTAELARQVCVDLWQEHQRKML